MSHDGWHKGPMLAYDLETTGLTYGQDQIVTAALALIRPGEKPTLMDWLLAPTIDIPEKATEVHGITTEYAREHGQDPAAALERITATLATVMGEGVPAVGANLQFDFTHLDRQCRAFGVEPLAERMGGRIFPVIDVYVIDRCNEYDEYRNGPGTPPSLRGGTKYLKARNRKLDTGLAPYYGVRVENAHNAVADALIAARVAYKMGCWYPDLAALKLGDLHAMQVAGKADHARFLAAHLRREGKYEEADGVRPEWPYIPEELTLFD